jgi:hypothetical protein
MTTEDHGQGSGSGWIYWLRNPAFPQMGKLGLTEGNLDVRVNALYTTGVPEPFTIVFARKVANPYEKEKLMHALLSDKRYSTRREFFEETDERVKMLFSLCEGVWWGQIEEIEDATETPVEPPTEIPVEPEAQTRRVWSRPALHELLSDGEPVYHTGSCPNERVGHYSRAHNAIMWSGSPHTLNQFMKKHYIDERPDRTSAGNAWTECKVRMGTSLVSMHSLCPSVQSSAP